jgi:fructose-bisphosphate aldolase class II
MFDGSKLLLEENIEKTKSIVAAAHKKNISVEAEVGAVGKAGGQLDFTKPEVAFQFAEVTGCDSLAVAFGNLHGAQTGEEKLDFDALAAIGNAVSIPLVFHGASNLSDEDYHKAIKLGIAKVNIDTEIRQAFVGAIKKYLGDNPNDIDPRAILSYARTSAEEIVDRKIKVFSNPAS